MKITYLGSFPPPYGGVTVKNALLFDALSEYVKVEKIDMMDLKRRNLSASLNFLKTIFGRDGVIILGVSASWMKRITNLMFAFNRTKMRRSLLFVMGGRTPNDSTYVAKIGCYKRIYVETESMQRALESMGVRNVSVYPNCRKRPLAPCEVQTIS